MGGRNERGKKIFINEKKKPHKIVKEIHQRKKT